MSAAAIRLLPRSSGHNHCFSVRLLFTTKQLGAWIPPQTPSKRSLLMLLEERDDGRVAFLLRDVHRRCAFFGHTTGICAFFQEQARDINAVVEASDP